MSVWLFFILVALLFFFGCPVVYSFLAASLVYFFVNDLNFLHAFKITINGVFSFILLAVPFFILAAQVMNEGKITNRLFDFANKLIGHIPGGLSHVNILSSVIFSGMSGSAVADTTGVGTMSAHAMYEKGFPKPYSAAVTISSAIIGPIIPPSIPMVLYAVVSNTSVGALFMGGVIPGLLMGLSLSLYCYGISRKRNYPRSERASLREIWSAFTRAVWPLLTPVILVGGIYSGIFTPTEAAVAASLYALLLSFVYRSLTLRKLVTLGEAVVKMSALVLVLLATVALFGYIVSIEQIPQKVFNFVMQFEMTRIQLLLVLNILLLFSGCILPEVVILIVFVPILTPIVTQFDISLIHFGVITVLNLMIGLTTPPFGLLLFVASGVLKVEMGDILKESWPMLICLVIVLFMVTYIEPLVMFLPNRMMQ